MFYLHKGSVVEVASHSLAIPFLMRSIKSREWIRELGWIIGWIDRDKVG